MSEPEWDVVTVERVLRNQLGDAQLSVSALQRLTGGASREIWSMMLRRNGRDQPVILRCDPPGEASDDGAEVEAAVMIAARAAGVSVPEVIARSTGVINGLFLELIEGEAVPRRVLRSEDLTDARNALAHQCGIALGRLHSMAPPPGLPATDRLAEYRDVLDSSGYDRPVLEMAYNWLCEHRLPRRRPDVVTHGDFRLGNLMIGRDGLRSVLDWESAHLASPLEDLGWLCTPAWRFGKTLPVGGFGTIDDLLAGYGEASGTTDISQNEMRWAIISATWIWAVGCLQQAERHRSGTTPSVDLAAVGRRVVENEADLLDLIRPTGPAKRLPTAPRPIPQEGRTHGLAYGPPPLTELLDAVRMTLQDELLPATDGRSRYQLRVCVNVLEMAIREVSRLNRTDGDVVAADDARLATAIRNAEIGEDDEGVVDALFSRTAELLDVVNPRRGSLFRAAHSTVQ